MDISRTGAEISCWEMFVCLQVCLWLWPQKLSIKPRLNLESFWLKNLAMTSDLFFNPSRQINVKQKAGIPLDIFFYVLFYQFAMRRVLTNFYMLFTKTHRYSDHPATLFRAFHLIWINSWTLQKNMPTAPQFIFHTANNAPQPRELRPPQKKGVRKKG